MKILYVCPNYNNSTYSYYKLIPSGLVQINCDVTFVKTINGYTNLNYYDVIIFGYRGFDKNFNGKIIKTTAKMYNLLGAQSTQDFAEKGITLNNNNILNLTSMFRIDYLKEKYFKNMILFNYSFFPEIFKDYKLEKRYDIGMTGALHNSSNYPDDSYTDSEKNIRINLVNLLENMKSKYNIFIKCSDNNFTNSRIVSDVEYAKTINSSKIWISCHAAYGDNCRNFQIPPCKTLLFCNEPVEQYPFGYIFKNKENCVYFKNDLSDFKEKVEYYLNNKNEYDRIVENGYREFHEKHTNVERAKELVKIIEES